jgi:glucose-1-phosphate adenylyltransferase
MGVYLFNIDLLDRALLEDHYLTDSSHDFGKDILPRLVKQGARVFAYPYNGYWVDVGTVNSYWQAHMDQLAEEPPFDLNDRSWVIHTRTEERPPVWIAKEAVIENSLICDGCVIYPHVHIDHSVLSPGVRVLPGAVVRESVILTDAVINAKAIVQRAIIDKRVNIGENARVGGMTPGEELVIAMIGKNSIIPAGYIIEPGAVIATDVIDSDYPAEIVTKNQYIETKRRAHEV